MSELRQIGSLLDERTNVLLCGLADADNRFKAVARDAEKAEGLINALREEREMTQGIHDALKELREEDSDITQIRFGTTDD